MIRRALSADLIPTQDTQWDQIDPENIVDGPDVIKAAVYRDLQRLFIKLQPSVLFRGKPRRNANDRDNCNSRFMKIGF